MRCMHAARPRHPRKETTCQVSIFGIMFHAWKTHLALWVSKDDTKETEALIQGLHTRHRLQENNHHNTHIGKTDDADACMHNASTRPMYHLIYLIRYPVISHQLL